MMQSEQSLGCNYEALHTQLGQARRVNRAAALSLLDAGQEKLCERLKVSPVAISGKQRCGKKEGTAAECSPAAFRLDRMS